MGRGGGKPLMSYKKRSRFSCCGTPLSVRAISIHSEAYMKSARCWEQLLWHSSLRTGDINTFRSVYEICQVLGTATVALLSPYGRYQYIQKRI